MKIRGQMVMLAALSGCLLLSKARAQSAPSQTDQSQSANPSQDQYSGVAHPPADETIKADEDAPVPVAKPSPAIPIPATPAVAAQPANNDYGMVSSAPANGGSLHKRVWNPDDDIVSYVPSNPNELAAGTNIRVRLTDGLSTTETRPGTSFRAVVAKDVYKEGRVIIPAGAEMRGRVVAVSQGHHLGPHATIRLRPETVMLPDGTAYHLYAEAVQSKAPGTRTNDEGGIQASSHYTKDAIEYGAGAGIGAVAGGELGGPVGVGVGSLVGAGVVTAHMLMTHPAAADLPEGSMLVFSLTEPMALTPTKN